MTFDWLKLNCIFTSEITCASSTSRLGKATLTLDGTLVAHNSSRIDQHVSAAGQVSNQLSTIAGSPWQPNGDMKNETIPRWQDQFTHTRDLGIQITLSIALGLSAFIAFCILRPKWTKL